MLVEQFSRDPKSFYIYVCSIRHLSNAWENICTLRFGNWENRKKIKTKNSNIHILTLSLYARAHVQSRTYVHTSNWVYTHTRVRRAYTGVELECFCWNAQLSFIQRFVWSITASRAYVSFWLEHHRQPPPCYPNEWNCVRINGQIAISHLEK